MPKETGTFSSSLSGFAEFLPGLPRPGLPGLLTGLRVEVTSPFVKKKRGDFLASCTMSLLMYHLFLCSYICLCVCFAHQPFNEVPNSIWPVPASISISGPPLPISPAFVFKTTSTSGVLKRGMTRYLEIILQQVGDNKMTHPRESSESLNELVLEVRSENESLNVDTSYWYMLKVSDGQAHIEAKTPYGAL